MMLRLQFTHMPIQMLEVNEILGVRYGCLSVTPCYSIKKDRITERLLSRVKLHVTQR